MPVQRSPEQARKELAAIAAARKRKVKFKAKFDPLDPAGILAPKPKPKTDWRQDPGGGYVEQVSGKRVDEGQSSKERAAQKKAFRQLKQEERARAYEESQRKARARAAALARKWDQEHPPKHRGLWGSIEHGLGSAAGSIFGPFVDTAMSDYNQRRGSWGSTTELGRINRDLDNPYLRGAGAAAHSYLSNWAASPDAVNMLTGRPYGKLGALLGAGAMATMAMPAAGVDHAAEEALGRALTREFITKAASKARYRPVWSERLGRYVITEEPSAGNRIGRALETAAETGRKYAHKTPLSGPLSTLHISRTGDEKIYEEAARTARETVKPLLSSDAKQVVHLGKKLSKDEQYALILIAEGGGPEVQARYAEHMAEQAMAKGNEAQAAAHMAHAGRFRNAAKYVEQGEDGKWYIRPDAPARLRKIEATWPRVQNQREDIYTSLGILSPEQLEARVQQPGRQVMGGRRVNLTEGDFYDLSKSEHRTRIRQDLLDLDIPEGQVDDLLANLDGQALNLWKQNVKKTKREFRLLKNANPADLTQEQKDRLRELYAMKRAGFENVIPKDLYYSQLGAVWRGFPESTRAFLNAEDMFHAALRGNPDAQQAIDVAKSIHEGDPEGFMGFLDYKRADGPGPISSAVDDIALTEARKAGAWARSGTSKRNYLPKGFRTKAKFAELTTELFHRAVEGLSYARDWYRESGQAILRHSGGDLDKADKLAALTAIYSPQQSVVPNIGLALRAYEEYITKGTITLGQAWQNSRALEAVKGLDWRAGYRENDAIKIRNFYGNLLKHIDTDLMKARGYTGREVTSDGWMGAAFKLGHNTDSVSISPQQHRMIERVTQGIADALGIEPEEAQAAIWTSIKASNDRFLADLPREEALKRAGVHFEAGLTREEHQVRIAFEAASTNIPEYASWAPHVQQAFLEQNAQAVLDAFHEAGLYAHTTDYGIGTWIDEAGKVQLNPAAAVSVNVGNRPAGDFALREESTAMYDALASIIGKNLLQDGAGWMRPFRSLSPGQHTFYKVTGNITPEQRGALAAELGDVGYITQHTDGVMVVRYDPESVLDDGVDNSDFAKRVAEAGKKILDPDVTVEGGTHRGGYLGGQDEYAVALGRVGAGDSAVDPGGRSGLFGRLDSDLASRTDAIRRDFIADPESAAGRGARGVQEGAGSDLPGAEGALGGSDRRLAPNFRPNQTNTAGVTYTPPDGIIAEFFPLLGEAFAKDHPDASNFLAYIAMNEDLIAPGAVTPIVFHELAHYAERAFKKYGLGKYAKAFNDIAREESGQLNREKWATGWEQLLLDPSKVKLPPAQKEALIRFGSFAMDMWTQATAIRGSIVENMPLGYMPAVTHAGRVERNELIDQVTSLFEALSTYENAKKGMRFVGAEDFEEGRFYLKLKRGLPISWRRPIARARAYRHQFSVMSGGNPKGAMSLFATDPEAKKQWLGFLKDMGYWKGNATEAVGESGIKAARIGTLLHLRNSLLPFASKVPTYADDIPMRLNIEDIGKSNPKLKKALDLLEDMELGKRKVDYSELHGLDLNTIEELKAAFHPDMIEGKPVREVVEEMMQSGVKEIPGIVWVSRDGLEAAGILTNAGTVGLQRAAWTAEIAGRSVDMVTNLIKLQMLQLNPAYYSMNFLGNTAMSLSQQGLFAPANLVKASFLSNSLGEEYSRLIDDLMGSGLQSIAQFRWNGDPAQLANVVNHYASIIVDMLPRRSAWLHEARRMGIKDPEELRFLLESAKNQDPEAVKVVDYITRRGKDALVDYDRLNPFEKKYIQRIVIFYPWIKGATRYTMRFPIEHPYQSLALAALFATQQNRAQDELGDRPWYSYLEVPVGHVTRGGKEYPYTINPKQLFTQTTPLEMGRSIEGFLTGAQNRQPLVETLSPVLEAGIEALAGRNSFQQEDQPQTIGSFFKALAAPPAIVKKIEDLVSGQGVDTNRLYPRNELDKILAVALGSLAPKPYNAEKGQYYARGHRGTPPRAKELQNLSDFEAAYGPLPEDVKAQVTHEIDLKAEYGELLDKAHQSKSNLSEAEIGKIKLDLVVRENPDMQQYYDETLKALQDPTAVNRVVGRLDKILWGSLEGLHRRLNSYNRNKAKAEQEGSVVSATG